MKQFIFLFFLIILLSFSFVKADINPSTLQINFDELVVGVEACKPLSITSDNSNAILSISDVWAENYTGEGSDIITHSASDFGIKIDYQHEINFDEAGAENIEICITANQIGNYKGKLVFSVENLNEGGVSSQMVIQPWIRVKVVEKTTAQTSSSSSGGSSSSSSGSSSSGGAATITASTTSNSVSEEDKELLIPNQQESTENNIQESSSWITGAFIGVGNNPGITIGIVLIVLMVIAITVYSKRRNKI